MAVRRKSILPCETLNGQRVARAGALTHTCRIGSARVQSTAPRPYKYRWQHARLQQMRPGGTEFRTLYNTPNCAPLPSLDLVDAPVPDLAAAAGCQARVVLHVRFLLLLVPGNPLVEALHLLILESRARIQCATTLRLRR